MNKDSSSYYYYYYYMIMNALDQKGRGYKDENYLR